MPEEEMNNTAENPEDNQSPADSGGSGCCCEGGCGNCPVHAAGSEGTSEELSSGSEPETGALVEKTDESIDSQQAGEEAAPGARKRRPRMGILCTALHGKMSRVDFFTAPELSGFPHGCKVILRTDRGTEMGTIIASPQEGDLAALKRRPGEVIRAATREDLDRQKQIERDIERNELKECNEEVAAHKLPMKLVAAEHLFGGEKVIFYFMSDGRVDFRKLVRDIAARYRTRIEFRQIGVRDEARLLAEYEHCGQPLCCRQFLRGLEPVTMRMAKLQKATLDPAKISGRCGRLMCCLRYEEDVYQYLRKQLPPRGVYVLTSEVAGQVISTDIISQRVTVNTGQRRVDIRVPDIVKISREPLEQPVVDVPAEPLAVAGARRSSSADSGPDKPSQNKAGTERRKRQPRQRRPRSESSGSGGNKDASAAKGGASTGKQSGDGSQSSSGRSRQRGGRRRGGRSRGRRGRSGGKSGGAAGSSGGKSGGQSGQ